MCVAVCGRVYMVLSLNVCVCVLGQWKDTVVNFRVEEHCAVTFISQSLQDSGSYTFVLWVSQ